MHQVRIKKEQSLLNFVIEKKISIKMFAGGLILFDLESKGRVINAHSPIPVSSPNLEISTENG